ncbi:circularly permuted type 2 ATP-grasp protein [Pedobacter sp. AW1-32]|uniref:circularly permuted type 2 ATP-grasp protein n=1 Tax=Pedobacter sp. AW1-32 TaxID=3383026 RepID=UPI003FEE64B9
MSQGITFTVYNSGEGIEKIFPFDIIPRIITSVEWSFIEKGIKQRLKALNLFLKDVYSNQFILKDQIVPARVIYSCPHFLREMHNVNVLHDIYIHIAGIDLIRDHDGTFYVLEDNLRTPSGVSYMLENREITKRLFRDLIPKCGVRSVTEYPSILYKNLMAISPRAVSNPTIVLLSPGMYNSAYYEHTTLARLMGVELVEGRDLVVKNQKVYMKTTYIDYIHQENFDGMAMMKETTNAIRTQDDTPYQIAIKYYAYVFQNFEYVKGITAVDTTIDEILALKAGVCQDFAHILTAMLRLMGIPARYVSGYICPNKNGMRGEGATHAWAEAFLPDYGWLGLDPTNNCIANENYVRLAVGRNFADCSPVKGVYKGSFEHVMEVNVSVGYTEDDVQENDQYFKPTEIKYTKPSALTTTSRRQNSYQQYMEAMQQQQQQQ